MAYSHPAKANSSEDTRLSVTDNQQRQMGWSSQKCFNKRPCRMAYPMRDYEKVRHIFFNNSSYKQANRQLGQLIGVGCD